MCAIFARPYSPDVRPEKGQGQCFRTMCLWTVLLIPLLSGCNGGDPLGYAKEAPYAGEFMGSLVADEQVAAHIGQAVLQAGGSAADAAIATGLALTVTLPSSAGLGGGGACLIYNHTRGVAESLDFLPQKTPSGMATPTLIRGLFALHARYGTTRWEELVRPSEALARFGIHPSQTLLSNLKKYKRRALRDPNTQKIFQDLLKNEHDRLFQPDLAAFLGRLRSRPMDLYIGSMGLDFITAARPTINGLSPTTDQFHSQKPVWKEAPSLKMGQNVLYSFSPAGVRDTVSAAWKRTPSGKLRPWGSSNLSAGATGLTVTDATGTVISCALSMNAPFGTGRMIPGFGVLTAPTSARTHAKTLPFSIGFVVNSHTNLLKAAITSTGRGSGKNAAHVLQHLFKKKGRTTLNTALADLARRAPGPAVTSGLYCPGGLSRSPSLCQSIPDIRGYGHGLFVGSSLF